MCVCVCVCVHMLVFGFLHGHFILRKKQFKYTPSLVDLHVPFADLGPDVQSFVSLTSPLRVISLIILAYSIHNILIFFAKKCE